MNWFCKKEAKSKPLPKPTKRSKRLTWKDPVSHEAGRTQVQVELRDGRLFDFWVYGKVEQYTNSGRDIWEGLWSSVIEPSVGHVSVINSLQVAKWKYFTVITDEMKAHSLLHPPAPKTTLDETFVDDPMNPDKAVTGQPIGFSIVKSEKAEVKFSESIVVDIV